MKNRTLYFGDNLEILKDKIPDEIFDLIYLDPPFNSKRSYNVLFKEGLQDSQAQIKAFEDSWHWTRESKQTFDYLVTKTNEDISNLMQALKRIIGSNDMMAYLTMMTVRLIELHRVLKPTGSLYLHCDPTASHYLKICLDVVFGKRNFRNELIWAYRTGGVSKKWFGRKHDILLFYSKSNQYNFYPLTERIYYKKPFFSPKIDKKGRYYSDVYMRDILDIPAVINLSKERLGYPTQKPEALLEKIVLASSKKGDLVLDPFCGCGTTVAVAEKLNRKWVGIDITTLAINLIKYRLKNQFGLGARQIYVDGLPTDLAGAYQLFKKDPFQFEYWALDLINAMPAKSKAKNKMQGADQGVDGVIVFHKDILNGNGKKNHNGKNWDYGKVIVQVKGGKVQRNQIATLKGDVQREKADAGILVSLEKPTKPMIKEAIDAGSFTTPLTHKFEFPKIQIITIEELLEGKKPDLPKGLVKNYYKEAKPVETENNGTTGRMI